MSAVEMAAWRFRFVDEAPSGAEVYRRFIDPRSVWVVRDTTADLPAAPMDQFICVIQPAGLNPKTKAWIIPPQDFQAVTTITINTDDGKLHWRPGQAVLEGSVGENADLMAGLVEFSFFENELRRLEQAMVPHQTTADRDVPLAYNIRTADRSQWNRLYQTMEQLYRLRLQFARLEPKLYHSSRGVNAGARRAIQRLKARADIEARLEALNDQLETIEDLYEGAIDRITDYRNYRRGHWLEIGIIILLGIEVALLLLHR
jgi:hypothetical protein